MEEEEVDQWGIPINGPRFHLGYRPFSKEDCLMLMSGIVPAWLQEAARVVEWSLQTLGVDYVGLNENYQRTLENRAALAGTRRGSSRSRSRKATTRRPTPSASTAGKSSGPSGGTGGEDD